MTNAKANNAQIVNQYLDALEKSDFDRMRSYLTDDFTYKGPTAQYNNPEDFIADIWRVSQILNRVDIRKTFVDGNDVCTFMNLHIHIDVPQTVAVVQWSVIRDGKIAAIEALFDATEYSAMFVKE